MIDAEIKAHTLRAHTFIIAHIRTQCYNPELATAKLWGILQDLESVGAMPEDIGSSFDEMERLLQVNNISWDEWVSGRRADPHDI